MFASRSFSIPRLHADSRARLVHVPSETIPYVACCRTLPDAENPGHAHVEARGHNQGIPGTFVGRCVHAGLLEDGNVSYPDVLGHGVRIDTDYLLDRDFAVVIVRQHSRDFEARQVAHLRTGLAPDMLRAPRPLVHELEVPVFHNVVLGHLERHVVHACFAVGQQYGPAKQLRFLLQVQRARACEKCAKQPKTRHALPVFNSESAKRARNTTLASSTVAGRTRTPCFPRVRAYRDAW